MSHDLIHTLLHRYGDAFVFGLLFLEAIGLPLPGETVMIAAALYAAGSHAMSPAPLFGAACAGAVLGGLLGYAIGKRFGGRLLRRYGPRIGYNADRQMLSHYLIDRNGGALVFFGRFFAMIRPFENLLAGATCMDPRRFALFNLLGGVAWTGLYCIGVYTFGHALIRLAGRAAIVLGIAAVVAVVIAIPVIRRQEARLIEIARQARSGSAP